MHKQLMILYLKDRKAYIILYLFMACALMFYFHTLLDGVYTFIYPLLLTVLPLCVFLLLDSIEYIRFCKKIMQNLNGQPMDFSPTTHEQKLIQKLLKQMNEHGGHQFQRLKKSYREHLYFSSHFMHHLKAPLSILEIILEDETEIEQIRKESKKQVKRINNTVNQALSLVRSEAFEKDLLVESVDLMALIYEIVEQVRAECEKAQIQLLIDNSITVLHIISDYKWLKVCIEQVISNAIKYSCLKDGLKKLEIIIDQQDSEVFLHIKDYGIGIPIYDQERIFEPFFTGENGRKSDFSSGLGLYLVKKICNQLNHQIRFKSIPKTGTTFTLCLKRVSKNLTFM